MKKTLDEQIAFYEKQLKLLKLLKEQPKEFHSLADYAQATGVKISYVYMLINRYNIKVQTYTEKQEEVLELLKQGFSEAEIARKKGISRQAVNLAVMALRKKGLVKIIAVGE